MRDLYFFRCHSDPALYIRKYGRCIIFIWVDDLLIFTTADVMKPLCDQILERFKGRSEGEIGEIGKVLGMEIMRDRVITRHQGTRAWCSGMGCWWRGCDNAWHLV